MRTLLGALTAILLLTICSAMPPVAQAGPPDRPDRLHWKSVDVRYGPAVPRSRRHRLPARMGGRQRRRRVEDPKRGPHLEERQPPHTKGLLFRDVEATDFRHVQVLAIGEGEASRIYRTRNGGKSWKLTFVNHAPKAFYDCMAMWPGGKHGIAMSDPVNGKFRIIATHDRGASWHVVNPDGMPAAKPGEFGFAASGTCLVTAGARQAWLASGGGAARIFHTYNRGRTWTVRASTIPGPEAGGVFSLSFRNPHRGLAVGGDLEAHDQRRRHVGVHPQQRSQLEQWRRPGRLPLRRRLGVRRAEDGDRGRPQRDRCDEGRRPDLADLQPPELRRRAVHARRGLLGQRPGGRGRPPRPVTDRPTTSRTRPASRAPNSSVGTSLVSALACALASALPDSAAAAKTRIQSGRTESTRSSSSRAPASRTEAGAWSPRPARAQPAPSSLRRPTVCPGVRHGRHGVREQTEGSARMARCERDPGQGCGSETSAGQRRPASPARCRASPPRCRSCPAPAGPGSRLLTTDAIADTDPEPRANAHASATVSSVASSVPAEDWTMASTPSASASRSSVEFRAASTACVACSSAPSLSPFAVLSSAWMRCAPASQA